MPSPEKFNSTLEEFEINKLIIDEINSGYEGIISGTSKKVKGAYFKRAVDILERELEPRKLRALLEANGCCKSGAREKASKAFAKENAGLSVAERLPKIEAVPYMGKPVLNDDGSITLHAVYYQNDGKYECACPNYNKQKRDYSVSKSYCYCCAGHFKYHYELMLGCKLETEILTSPLDSDGENPCVMKLSIVG